MVRGPLWSLVGRVLLFAGIVVIAGWPQAEVARRFSVVHSYVTNAVLDSVTFGKGGHAVLDPVRPQGSTDENVLADATVLVSVDGFKGNLAFGMSARRETYIPLLILLALVVVAPLPMKKKPLVAAIGIAVVGLLATAGTVLQIFYIFASQMPSVVTLSAPALRALTFAYQALLLPPSNRVIVPLAVGGALVAWQLARLKVKPESEPIIVAAPKVPPREPAP